MTRNSYVIGLGGLRFCHFEKKNGPELIAFNILCKFDRDHTNVAIESAISTHTFDSQSFIVVGR